MDKWPRDMLVSASWAVRLPFYASGCFLLILTKVILCVNINSDSATMSRRPSALTCAHRRCEDPALPVFHRLGSCGIPLPQDGHAAGPLAWADAARVVFAPVPKQDPAVIIAVDLEGSGN